MKVKNSKAHSRPSSARSPMKRQKFSAPLRMVRADLTVRQGAAPCKVPVSQHLSVGSVGRSFHPWTRQMDLLLDIGTIAACRPLYRCRHLRVLSPVWANVFWFRRRLIAAARDAKYGTLVTATEAPILTTPIALSGERLARFRRCCRFRSFHLAFWLLLSFARAALVHLKPFGHSVAAVSERPDPPVCGDGPGLVTTPTAPERLP